MNQTKSTSKKLLALLLALIMTVSLLPMSVFAAEMATDEPAQEAAMPGGEQDAEDAALTEEGGEDGVSVYAAEDGIAVQAATTINYVTKNGSGKTLDDTFYRIFLLDCGRKYFSVSEIEDIIDQLAENHYTHIELAFGNEGLRFLLNDMTLDGYDYTSDDVRNAILTGNNSVYNDPYGNALSQTEMDTIIQYANERGIGVIPLFNAPGHMHAVVKAMEELEMGLVSDIDYKVVEAAGNGKTANYAVVPTSAAAVNFVQALMQKYVNYFAGKKCTMFNIGADESGITSETYPAYAKLVNSHAAMVQNANMVAMAFNDGIYNPSYANINIENNKGLFDSNIVISYWDAGGGTKYAQASQLANAGHKINSTHNNWYYVLGNNTQDWAGYYAAKSNMKTVKCTMVDGGSTTQNGCTLAVWCDYPSRSYNTTYDTTNKDNVSDLIKEFATNNPDYFKAEAPKEPELTVETPAADSGVSCTAQDSETHSYTVMVKPDTQDPTVQLRVDNAEGKTLTWESSDTSIATVDQTGAVTFTRKTGTVTITAKVNVTEQAAAQALRAATDGETALTATFQVVAYSETPVTEQRTITVTVGGTATDFIEDKNYSTETPPATEDVGIATVESVVYGSKSVKSFKRETSVSNNSKYYIQSSTDETKYLKEDGTWGTIEEAAQWTYVKSGNSYYLKGDNNTYLQWDNTSGAWTTTNQNNRTRLYFDSNSGSFYRTRTGKSNNYTYSNPLGVPGDISGNGTATGTTITFKGVAADTTYVTIGNVRYTINVVAEDLTGVSPLPIQLWITNYAVQAAGTSSTTSSYWAAGWSSPSPNHTYARYYSVAATAKNVNTETGAAITELLPNNIDGYEHGGTYWENNTYDEDAVPKTLVVWSGRVHTANEGNVQKIYGNDYSNDGTEFNYVRYLNGKWEVSADGKTGWTEVKGTNTQSTEQLVVYYMLRTQVTEEVITDVADWGNVQGDTKYGEMISSDSYVMLDFRVVYPEGTKDPTTFPQNGKSFMFHCNKNVEAVVGTDDLTRYRQLNNFRGVNLATGDYEVYMVTVTMTSDSTTEADQLTLTATSGSYDHKGEEQIVWAIDEKARDDSGLNTYSSISGANSVYSGCTIGGDPYIRGVEVYNKHGALITYYLRNVKTSALTVHYIDQASKYEFHSYGITAADGVTFHSDIRLNKTTADSWKGPLVNGTVINQKNVELTVSADLSTMPTISASYRYAINYECVDVKRSNDGKDVYLYYTFETSKTFVVDFGLPLKITPEDFSAELKNAVLDTVSFTRSAYATITTDSDWNVIYTLEKTIDSEDSIIVGYKGAITVDGQKQTGYVSYPVKIIPASTVYYEDSFVKFSKDGEGKNIVGWTRVADAGKTLEDVTTAEKNATQALEFLGDNTTDKNVYGYDPAYDNCTMFSMGSAMKTTVSDDNYATATFTFKGTGFDVISMASNSTGTIVVTVTDGKGYEKNYVVDTYYGYRYDEATETWIVSENDPNTLYQIPVMKVTVPYGTYTATVTAAYNKVFAHNGTDRYDFYLDAIRVYNPMGADYADYTKDQEGYPQYIKLRNELAKENDTTVKPNDKLLFIDGKKDAEVALYRNYGPNNEVYLMDGQAITFKLTGLANVDKIQIGAKSPMGDKSAVMMVNNNKVGPKVGEEISDITTATEMYYDITEIVSSAEDGQLTITNPGGAGILSLTNLKITFKSDPGNTKVALGTLTDTEQANAVQMVRAMYAPAPEPDPEPVVFVPERFEASWNRSTVKVGQKATLTVKTSEDVDAITVDGVAIDTYRTRTQRTGWGWNAKRVTYREFTYTITAKEAGTLNCSIAAFNAENTASEPITAALTVQAAAQRPSWGGWLGNLFGRWF